jgi:hypothetical protein
MAERGKREENEINGRQGPTKKEKAERSSHTPISMHHSNIIPEFCGSCARAALQKCCQVTDLDRAELMERAENQTSADGSSLSALNTASAHRNPFLEAV